MSSLRTLLQNTDPLRHELPRLDAERDRIRRTMLRVTPVERSPRSVRARLPVAATLAIAALGVVALGYQLWTHGTTPLLAAVRFEVRLAEDRPIPGLVVAQMAEPGRVIYLHPEIVVNNDDIAQSSVLQDGPDRFGVRVQLLPAGAERVRQATAAHVGRPMAILIDGVVVMAPVVRSPVVGDSAVISGNFTQIEAERIVDGIGRRWPLAGGDSSKTRTRHRFQPPLQEIAHQGRLLPDWDGTILQPENEIEARWLTSQCAKPGRALRSVTVAVHTNLQECIAHRDQSAWEER
jgi:hypothetical protein